jgi:hypothetical protein
MCKHSEEEPARGESRRRMTMGVIAMALFGALELFQGASAASRTPNAAPTGCYCVGRVGNVNCDFRDEVTLLDILVLVDHLYVSGAPLPNRAEANADGDPAGNISLNDIMALVDHLFIRGTELPECPKPHNEPPVTKITEPVMSGLYINSAAALSPATGVRAAWSATDTDHPYIPPTFEFEYRMYGPYSDSVFNVLRDSFIFQVFISNDGQMLRRGQANRYILCDTIWLPGGIREISCDTVLIDTLSGNTWFGRIDTLLDVEAQGFVNNADFNRVAFSSRGGDAVWTTATRDTLYDLFADYPSDTTWTANFIFWVRARDPVDPDLSDPTPAFRPLKVISPQFERSVLVASSSHTADDNGALRDTARAYWDRTIDTWIEHSGLSGAAQFDTARDYVQLSAYSQNNSMRSLALRYKVVIVFQDASVSGAWSVGGSAYSSTVSAISAGVNAWVAARVPMGNHPAGSSPFLDLASPTYQFFFGVEQVVFPGWTSGFYTTGDSSGLGLPRLEDFVGAYSQNPSLWPDLAVDTALLHWRYRWEGSIDPPVFPYYPFLPEIGALPQVGYVVPTADAEVMYTYKSKYGPIHAITQDSTYEGEPVMVRVDRGTFRTVHSNFTPLSLEETTSQQMVDSVLNWLYEKWRDGEKAHTLGGRISQ